MIELAAVEKVNTETARASVRRDGVVTTYDFAFTTVRSITMCNEPRSFHVDFADYCPEEGGGAPASYYLARQIIEALFDLRAGRRVNLPICLDAE